MAPQDQRYASTYIFGAVCPQQGKGAALVLPQCNTEAMNLHLAEIAIMVSPGRHAVLLLDQAGWHLSDALAVLTFPPELGPAGMRELAFLEGGYGYEEAAHGGADHWAAAAGGG